MVAQNNYTLQPLEIRMKERTFISLEPVIMDIINRFKKANGKDWLSKLVTEIAKKKAGKNWLDLEMESYLCELENLTKEIREIEDKKDLLYMKMERLRKEKEKEIKIKKKLDKYKKE